MESCLSNGVVGQVIGCGGAGPTAFRREGEDPQLPGDVCRLPSCPTRSRNVGRSRLPDLPQMTPARQSVQIRPGQPVVRGGPVFSQSRLMHWRRVSRVDFEPEVTVLVGQFGHQCVPSDLGDHRGRRYRDAALISLDHGTHLPRCAEVVVLPVQDHRVRSNRQLPQGSPGGQLEGGGHSKVVDLLGPGVPKAVRSNPAGEHLGKGSPSLDRQQLRVGEALWRSAKPSDSCADRDRACPGTSADFVDSGDDLGPGGRSQRPLDAMGGWLVRHGISLLGEGSALSRYPPRQLLGALDPVMWWGAPRCGPQNTAHDGARRVHVATCRRC